VRSGAGAALVLATLLATSCGSGEETRAKRQAGPAPKLEGVQLKGSIPGDKVTGAHRDERGQSVTDVHRLLVVGDAERRVALLIGRRQGVPCVGAAPVAEVGTASMDCFESFENPPFVAKVVVGGETGRRTGWLAVLGLSRAPTADVALDSQSGAEVPLTVRSWSGFSWEAFGAMTTAGDLGNQLSAFDRNGDPVAGIDLGFSYDPRCLQNNEDVCGASPGGPWTATRDPTGAGSGGASEDVRIAFAHPAVRRLVAGHTFFLNWAVEWQRCDGSALGSVVLFRIWPPVDFQGEIPFHALAKENEDVAYREGRAYVEAEKVTSVEAFVDHRRRHVVGIVLDAFDDTANIEEPPLAKMELDVIEEPQPAGGLDDADKCPDPGD
jgi:hypothetical protein